MIEKLRKRFILYTILSVFALLFVLLSVINVTNFSLVASDADRITQMLVDSGGNFGGPPENENMETPSENGNFNGGFIPGGPNSPETRESTRYFSYLIDSDGNITQIAYNISGVSEEDAESIVKNLVSNNGTGWTNGYYRYRVQNNGDETTTVVVIDQSRELRPSYQVMYISIFGTLAGLVIVFLILIPVSKKLIKPIEQSDEKQKRFISDAARELKVPITVMSANNEVIKNKIDEEIAVSNSKQIKKMQKLVGDLDNLVVFDKISKFERENLNVAEIANKLIQSYEKSFEDKKIKLEKDYEDLVEFSSNENMLKKMFVEIFDNGLKYSKSYFKISIKKVEERFVFETFNDCDLLPDGDLDRVFERFYRMQNGINSKIDGNGVGLSIVREITTLHQGRYSAKGENGVFHLKVEL